MFFVYELGERVKVKSNGKTGTVKTRKFEDYEYKNQHTEMVRYYVHFHGYHSDWVNANDLESLDNPTFSHKFEEELTNLMIDANLIVGNYDQVKLLSEQKRKK